MYDDSDNDDEFLCKEYEEKGGRSSLLRPRSDTPHAFFF